LWYHDDVLVDAVVFVFVFVVVYDGGVHERRAAYFCKASL
jgi:hypothetical protein